MAQDRGARGLKAGTPKSAAAIRCFVALQPDAAARSRLDELAREQHGRFPSARRMRAENLHLTLAFIGALEAERARQVAAALAAASFAPFTWALDAVGSFGRARVLWAGGRDACLDAIAAQVRRLLDELRVPYDRKPFVAHVTLLRKLPGAATHEAARPLEPPIRWLAGALVLLESRSDAEGTRYVPVPVRGSNG